jgi:hypothetical protein
MAGLFGPPDYLKCCCQDDGPACTFCPNGPYPDVVTVSIPSLGITDIAVNGDPGIPGEFQYLFEGSNSSYYWQCTFLRCQFFVRIYRIESPPPDTLICLSADTDGNYRIRALSCPPEPLIVTYQVQCQGGGTLDIILSE